MDRQCNRPWPCNRQFVDVVDTSRLGVVCDRNTSWPSERGAGGDTRELGIHYRFDLLRFGRYRFAPRINPRQFRSRSRLEYPHTHTTSDDFRIFPSRGRTRRRTVLQLCSMCLVDARIQKDCRCIPSLFVRAGGIGPWSWNSGLRFVHVQPGSGGYEA
jgi:hypothetical protein